MEVFTVEFWSFLWDAARYEALVERAGPWAPAFAIAAMVIVSFLPVPAETVAIANGMAFGQGTGFLFTWIGAVVAASIAFCLARWLGQPVIYRVLPPRMMAGFERRAQRWGAPFLLLVRLIPFIPYTVVNYGSGLAPIRFRTYFWTSAVGMTPPIFAFVSAGAMMKENPSLGWATIAATLAVLAVFGYVIHRRLKARDNLDYHSA